MADEFDLAAQLVADMTKRSAGLRNYLLAQARNLPADPAEANARIAKSWPNLTEDERELALVVAVRILRITAQECQGEAFLLEALIGRSGNA